MPRCPRASPSNLPVKSSIASLARVSRSGFTSGVDMLREVSIAKMISIAAAADLLPVISHAAAPRARRTAMHSAASIQAALQRGAGRRRPSGSAAGAGAATTKSRERGVLARIVAAPQPDQAEAGQRLPPAAMQGWLNLTATSETACAAAASPIPGCPAPGSAPTGTARRSARISARSARISRDD